jgi:hypothetical protein
MNKVIDKIIGIRNRRKKSSPVLPVEEKPEVQKGRRVKNTVTPEQLPITEVNPDLQVETEEEVQTESKPRRSRTSTTSN